MKILKNQHTTAVVIDESTFNRMLWMERKRSERTGAPFLLVLINFERLARARVKNSIEDIGVAIAAATRDTDITGWHRYRSTVGVICTALNGTSRNVTRSAVSAKIHGVLTESLEPSEIGDVEVSFLFFPENDESSEVGIESGRVLYAGNENEDLSKRSFAVVKRATDIVGSLTALLIFSPLFLIIAVLIKMTSAGPVFHRQKRLGKFGVVFTLLKFRSMYVENDWKIHREFVQSLNKIQKDPRITRFGHLLSASHLDDLPQLINVLLGEMSLVGPCPPIPYEFECYQLWHRRRILEARPGITGLWQVYGRSRISFDDMVRLDLQYIRNRSLWIDLKILLKTTFAMIAGHGAY